MRVRIQKSILFAICMTLLATFLLLASVFYMQNMENMKEEIRQEAIYVQTAIEILGEEYLEDMDRAQILTRITMIDTDGSILYDSVDDTYQMENHLERQEVKAAFEHGEGESLRTSETVGKRTYYYAVRMSNGMVLRASKTIDNLIPTMLRVIPYLIGVILIMIIFSWYLAKWQTKRLIAPINDLDLSVPLENEIYEELTPLLTRIDEQNREKEAIANLRKEFSANVSHELKTPLTSISGYAEIMKSGMVKENDMISFSERIYNEASRMITLIGDIIKLSKLDEEQVELEKEEVDLYLLARDVCSRLSLSAAKKNISIELSGEQVNYEGVRRILDEMLYNICENAIKYNVEGGSVSVWVGETLNGIRVIVKDTGIGIPEEHLERIFERFYRVDKSHSRETGGTGLGLSIVKHGAIYHHAEVLVESEVGKGTKMEIVF